MRKRVFETGRRALGSGWQVFADGLQTRSAVWLVPAVCALLAWGATWSWPHLVPPNQVAVARIILDPAAAGAAASAREWIATQAALIGSERVARRVLQDLSANSISIERDSDEPGVAWLLSNLRVMPVGEGGLVSVAYRSASPELAVQMANGFVTAYDSLSQEIQRTKSEAAAAALRQRVTRLREEVDSARARLEAARAVSLGAGASALAETARLVRVAADIRWSGFSGMSASGEQGALGSVPWTDPDALIGALPAVWNASIPVRPLREEYELARQALVSAQSRLSDINSWEKAGRPTMVVLDSAEVLALPAGTDAFLPALIALAGAFAGVLLRLLARRLDTRVHHPANLASKLGMPVLGTLVNADRAANCASQAGRFAWRASPVKPVAAPILP
jgi:capsular polysaccharide biosynthesis protein